MKSFKILIPFFLYTIILYSQDTPENIVRLNFSSTNKIVKKDTAVNLELKLSIKKGWHINSNNPLDPNLVPTFVSLEDTSAFKVIKILYPLPIMKKLPFSEKDLSLFEDEAAIKILIRISNNCKKKNLIINGKIRYQPCNNQTCLFPTSKSFSAVLTLL